MPTKITVKSLVSQIQADPDMHALGMLPIDSFARHAYQTKSYPDIKGAYGAANANPDECQQWHLTAEEWVEEMEAAAVALAHDVKLDLARKGFESAV